MSIISATATVGNKRGGGPSFTTELYTALVASGFEVPIPCLEATSLKIYDPTGSPFNWILEPLIVELAEKGFTIPSRECLVSTCQNIYNA